MRSSTTSQNSYTAAQNYSSAVPLSVYKELAAQLHAAETRLNLVNAENQALVKQNQQLRQEVEKAVNSVLHLQQRVNATVMVDRYTTTEARSKHRGTKAYDVSSLPPKNKSPKLYTEQEQGRYRRHVSSANATEMNGWGLAIAILTIMTFAFGTGYLIVRPLMSGR